MRTESRVALLLSALMLLPAFVLPLWSIRIVAPQYREGLGMYIGLRDIWGHDRHDIQNINILNHYIGMKPIDPETVGALTIMPWAVALLMVAAIAAAVIGKRGLITGWLVAFVGLGLAGLYEFWYWNRDYGHNLDPMAPIKIPGMTYQPPLLGTKQLLNMTTTSFPSWGTLFVAVAFGLALLALVNEYRGMVGTARRVVAARMPRLAPASVLLVLAAVAAGCEQGRASEAPAMEIPVFAAEQPPCDYCDGRIPEARFGGEVTTTSGYTYRFMSIECLAGFLLEERVPMGEIAAVRVVDYGHGERLIDARSARYVRMQFEHSPNGLDLAAVETEKVAGTLHYFLGGERMSWEQVLEYVRTEWEL